MGDMFLSTLYEEMQKQTLELKRSNHLMALLIQVVVETHGNSLKYGKRLKEIMDGA